jgi:hypothetical protein
VHQVCLRGERYRQITVKCRKREKQLQSRSRSREHPRLDISLNKFPSRAFFLHLGNFLLSSPGLFFLISSLSLFIFVLPPNTVFVPRTLQRQVRDPTGATAGSLRRATYNAPHRHNHHRQTSPSPESRSPASGSD